MNDGVNGGAAQTTRDFVRPARSIFISAVERDAISSPSMSFCRTCRVSNRFQNDPLGTCSVWLHLAAAAKPDGALVRSVGCTARYAMMPDKRAQAARK